MMFFCDTSIDEHFSRFLSFFFDLFVVRRAVSELAEALRDSDDVKKQGNEWAKENKDLRERLEALEKEIRIKSLQPRSPGKLVATTTETYEVCTNLL